MNLSKLVIISHRKISLKICTAILSKTYDQTYSQYILIATYIWYHQRSLEPALSGENFK